MTENAAQFEAERDDVFARIAHNYDRYCDYFSLYIQRLWKRTFAREVASYAGDWLDLASGTGDIPFRVLQYRPRSGKVLVSDICQPMLEVAKAKFKRQDVQYVLLDACALTDIPDESYDVISMAFAMKIIDREKALTEIYRCLKPGGVFLCIEASRIGWSPLHALYLTYMDICLPLMGRIIARGDHSAYDYLLRGIHDFPGGRVLAETMEAKGFNSVSYRPLSFGIVAIHRAFKITHPL